MGYVLICCICNPGIDTSEFTFLFPGVKGRTIPQLFLENFILFKILGFYASAVLIQSVFHSQR